MIALIVAMKCKNCIPKMLEGHKVFKVINDFSVYLMKIFLHKSIKINMSFPRRVGTDSMQKLIRENFKFIVDIVMFNQYLSLN